MTVKIKDEKRVKDALRDGAPTFFYLAMEDGYEVGDAITEGTYQQDSGGAISCNLTLDLRLPRTYDDSPTALAVEIDGVLIPQMLGLVSLPEIDEETKASTNFLAASPRSVASQISLDDETDYPGWTPEDVVKDAIERLPYWRGASRIQPLKEPILYYDIAHQSAFRPYETVADVLNKVEGDIPTSKARDNVFGGTNYSLILQNPESPRDDYRTYIADDFVKWRPPPRAERRYSEVVVYTEGEDGGFLYEPRRAKVNYQRHDHPPIKGTKLWIKLEDRSSAAPQKATNLANDTALRLSRGLFRDDSTILPHFDPLIEYQDVFWVYEEWEDSKKFWARQWMCWVDTYKHDIRALTTEVSHTAALIEEDEIKTPVLSIIGLSGGVLKTLIKPCDYIGKLVRLDTEELEWAEEYGTTKLGGLYPDDTLYPLETLYPEDPYEGDLGLVQIAEDAPEVTVNGDLVTINCGQEAPIPSWGEMVPDLIRFETSVAWASVSGDLLVIDTASSGGNASVSGDLVVIS